MVRDIAEEWQTENGQIYGVLLPCFLPVLGMSETINHGRISFVIIIKAGHGEIQ